MLKRILLICFLTIIQSVVHAQLSKKHWISPIHSRATNQVEDHYVYLSTPELTPFDVLIMDGSGNPLPGSPVTISQSNPVRFQIGTGQPSVMFLDTSDLNMVQPDKGLILEASTPFYVSFRVRSSSQAGYLTSKGTIGTGNKFRLGSLPQKLENQLRNFYASVMATEDNTVVTISEYDPAVEFITNSGTIGPDTITITLNTGETYTVSGYTNVTANLDGFVGALVTSDKPITVNTGNALGSIANFGGQDFAIDQIVPEDVVGKEYAIIEAGGTAAHERPIVIATVNGTEVFINNNSTALATLNAGEYIEVDNSFYQGTSHRNMLISSTEPIYVYQGLAGSTANNATSGMNFLPPLSCLLLREVNLIADIDRIGSTTYAGDVFAITTTGSTISINDNPVTLIPEPMLGNPGWETYRISGLSGNVKVASTGPLSVGLFGFEDIAGFGGYYSGFGFDANAADVKICSNETGLVNILEKLPGNPLSGGTWTPAFASGSDFFEPDVDPETLYTYTFLNDCANIIIDVNISITTSPTINAVDDIILCDDATADGITSFDFTANRDKALGTQNPADFTVSFYPTQTDATNRTNSITNFNGYNNTDGNTSTSETIYVIVTSNENAECVTNIETFEINVISQPVANPPSSDKIVICDNTTFGNDTDGLVSINLQDLDVDILNGQDSSLFTVSYHLSQSNADANSSPLTKTGFINTRNPQSIFTRVSANFGSCYDTREFQIEVKELPNISNQRLVQCDLDFETSTTDGITSFNLFEGEDLIVGTDTSLTVSFFSSISSANVNINALEKIGYRNSIPFSETIYAKVTGQNSCERIVELELVVNSTLTAIVNRDTQYTCDNNSEDSIAEGTFDLDTIKSNLYPSQDVAFYSTTNNAALEINELPSTFTTKNTIVYTRIESANECIELQQFSLEINVPIEIPLEDEYILCKENPILNLEGNNLADTFQWFKKEDSREVLISNKRNVTITSTGSYILEQGTNFDNGGINQICTVTKEFTIVSSEIATITSIEKTQLSDRNSLTVSVFGDGDYEYSLELVATANVIGKTWPFQNNNRFDNLPAGEFILTVNDKNGCGSISKEVFILGLPKYFTPNNDGFNDLWQIQGITNANLNGSIFIFDRFGKLLKKISFNSPGWDGKLYGKLLPIDEYWYKMNIDGKSITGHFTLKR